MGSGDPLRLVLDTNVVVAEGFNPKSTSARIIDNIAQGHWIMVWNQNTRRETLAIVSQIPPLSSTRVSQLFHEEHEFTGPTHPERFSQIEDPDDRKFAALAAASGAILVTNDDHLLSKREQLEIDILTPKEVMARYA